MSDARLADIARRLAAALNESARERTDAARKAVSLLQTELCAAVRAETAEANTALTALTETAETRHAP